MDISIPVSMSWELVFENEPWAGVMDQGKKNAVVDSPTIELPQEGIAASEATDIHGQEFQGTSEPGSHFIENAHAKIKTLLPGLSSDIVNGDVSSAENLLTNVVRADTEGISGEYRDNENEDIATDMVINSLHVVLTVSPSLEEIHSKIIEVAKEKITEQLKEVSSL